MKIRFFLIWACLVASLVLVACDSGQSGPKTGTSTVLPYPTSQFTPKAAVASPTATGGGDISKAPQFEVIAAMVKSIIGDKIPVAKDRVQAVYDYGRSLQGKTFKWQGWVEGVAPDKFAMEQLNELNKYTGTFWVTIVMDDPRTGDIIGSVELVGVTRQQVEQFVEWYDPPKGPPYERAEFTGTIEAMPFFDELMIAASASSMILVPGLATPHPMPAPTPTAIIQGGENPAPPFEEISATMKSIVASTTPGSDQRYQKLGDYSQALRGKTVQWEGWVFAVSPNEPYMKQQNELETFNGDFGLWVSMHDLNTTQNMTVTTQVVVGRITRQQVEQFILWRDPTKYPPFQKIRFTGTIDIVGYDESYDSYRIEVRASTVMLLK